MEEIAKNNPAKIPLYQLNKSFEDVFERIKMLTSGHENCPLRVREELIIWWKTNPP